MTATATVPVEGRAVPATSTPGATPAPEPGPPRDPPVGLVSVLVVVLGLLVTGILSWTSWSQFDHTEDRLVGLRVREAGSLISAALPGIQTPLASAASLADATGGDAARFAAFMAPYAGTGHQFVSASLWRPGGSAPVAVVGVSPRIASDPAAISEFFARSEPASMLRVTGFLDGANPRLGYGFTASPPSSGYIAYAETALHPDRRLRISSDSAFADMNYALYLGRSPTSAGLLQASVAHLPIRGRHATAVIPFGDSAFTLVLAPTKPLSEPLSGRLPWIIGVVGTLLAAGLGLLTERLVRRRRDAERLAANLDRVAGDNRRLYAEQRTVAETLQRALLPQDLPRLAGADIGVHYVPGVEGIHIGGDWYDIITVDDRRVLLVVGDVSGRGLRAATVMASLLYAVRAYAAQGDAPDAILTKLSALLTVERTGHFATVLCVLIDLAGHRITVANAGHLPLLVVHGGTATYIDCPVGFPVGVSAAPSYIPVTLAVPSGATLLAFTDGLVERRGESLDVGLARLQDMADVDADPSLGASLALLARRLVGDGTDDDTVVLGVRWTS